MSSELKLLEKVQNKKTQKTLQLISEIRCKISQISIHYILEVPDT